MATMTFDEVIELLREPPGIERTRTYILKRGCWPYQPHGGRDPAELAPHVRERERNCFNCGEGRPQYPGECWGNTMCEIWVCGQCAPEVRDQTAEPAQNDGPGRRSA